MRRLGDVCQDICRELRRGGGLSHRMPTRYRKSYPLRFQVQVFAKSEGRCFYCGGGADVMDHVVPVSSGGRDAFDNLVPACWRCNCGKGGRSVEQYRDTRARADPESPDFTENSCAGWPGKGSRCRGSRCTAFGSRNRACGSAKQGWDDRAADGRLAPLPLPRSAGDGR